MDTTLIINIVIGIIAVAATFVSYYFYIKSVLTKATAGAIESAEQTGKTGEEKLTLATEQIYALVPAVLKPFISEKLIRQMVQSAFDAIEAYAKKQLNKNK